MPELRVLSPEEAAKRQSRRGRAVDLSEYLSYLQGFGPGQLGEATLCAGEKRGTIKRRLTAAAKSLGKELRYRRSGEDALLFELKAD